jgi:hypothetical protein
MKNKYDYLDDFNGDDELTPEELRERNKVKQIKVKDGLVEHLNKELILEDGRKLLRD